MREKRRKRIVTGDLIGRWESDPVDFSGMGSYGKVTIEFAADGSLTYSVHERDRDRVMILTFLLEEPGFIVTNQPSAPRPEKTAYEITADGKLILEFGGKRSRYVRISL